MGNPVPATISVIARAIKRLLTDRGPLTEDEIGRALAEDGIDLGRAPDDTLADVLDSALPLVLPLPDGRMVLLPALLAGRVFTHRVTAIEIEHDLVDVSADLEPLSILTDEEEYLHLADGSDLVEVMSGFDDDLIAERGISARSFEAVTAEAAWLLPPRRLSGMGVVPGDLIGVRVGASGWVIERIDDTSLAVPPADLGDRLISMLAEQATGGPAQVDTIIWNACADDPGLFVAPLPPLRELLDTFGLARDGEQIAPAGFDFGAWRVQMRLRQVCERYDLTDDEALTVLTTTSMYREVRELYDVAKALQDQGAERQDILALVQSALESVAGPGRDEHPAAPGPRSGRTLVRDTLGALEVPEVAAAVLSDAIDADRDGAAAFGLFVELLEPVAPRAARPALHWLRAMAYQRLGRIADAEAALSAGQKLDPSWPPILYELARFASDRSDAERGLALLRRARVPADDHLFALLERFQPPVRPDLARNEPCWCGSGRKYKQCHLGREQLALADRAAWLYEKAATYLMEGPWRAEVLDLVFRYAADPTNTDAVLGELGGGLVIDAMLFEGGAFAEFLAARGALLPDDEQLLGQQWLLAERSVFEVETVRPGVGLRVRDLRTGDRHELREATASRQLTPGTLICSRIVPAGQTVQSFGGIEGIGLRHRDQLLALLDKSPDPETLVGFLATRFAPPALENTEGDSLVLCEAQLKVPDRQTLIQALDRAYDRQDSDGSAPQWFEHVTTHRTPRIRATLRLDGDVLVIDANSDQRMDRVLATVTTAQPGLTVIDEVRTPIADFSEALSRAAGPGATDGPGRDSTLDPNDPQLAAALDEYTRQYEAAWLDMGLPALAGRTPRQAAADPTRRPDLIRLLASFPADDPNPGMMSLGRLRVALQLDEPAAG